MNKDLFRLILNKGLLNLEPYPINYQILSCSYLADIVRKE